MITKLIKNGSLRSKIVAWIFISLVAAVVFFLVIDTTSSKLLGVYYNSSAKTCQNNDQSIAELQAYIDQHQLKQSDIDTVNTWVDSQSIINLKLYKKRNLIYDSDYPNVEVEKDSSRLTRKKGVKYYNLQFADGSLTAEITGFYSYQMYAVADIVNVILAFMVFLLMIMVAVGRVLRRMRQLCSDMEILEGGNLEYSVDTSGNDEISHLAISLNNMRLSLQEKMEEERLVQASHKRMIKSLSHDIRTPLTSIMIYAEILKTKKYQSEEQMDKYLGIIDARAKSMKQMTDHLSEYAMVTAEADIELTSPQPVKDIFYELISENCEYLTKKGFTSVCNSQWPKVMVRANMEYLLRIFDNIISNICKYADPDKPVRADLNRTDQWFVITYSNEIDKRDKAIDSSGIGIQNIVRMMQNLNGHCKYQQDSNFFSISLYFPVEE